MPFGFSNGNMVGSFSGGEVWMHSLADWGDQPALFALEPCSTAVFNLGAPSIQIY